MAASAATVWKNPIVKFSTDSKAEYRIGVATLAFPPRRRTDRLREGDCTSWLGRSNCRRTRREADISRR